MNRYVLAICGLALAAPAYSFSLPANNINCLDFLKQPNGNWASLSQQKLKLGTVSIGVQMGTVISPGAIKTLEGDLHDVITAKCASI